MPVPFHESEYLDWFEEIFKDWRIEYNSDYGIDHRAGYSITIDGIVVVEFESERYIALYRVWKWYEEQPRKD